MFSLQDVLGHHPVPVLILGVEQDKHQVKSAEQGAGQRDVHAQGLVGVIIAFRIGGS